jgi:murein DD-endopeptidase MepM/ murein hydrolase activator NlpD
MKALVPVPGRFRVTSPFGFRRHPITDNRRLHTGVDLVGAKKVQEIIAPEDGTVLEARKSTAPGGGYGYFVKYRGRSGFVHLMAHLVEGSIKVKPKQKVKQGDVLGIMGTTGASTGVHLHWEVRWRVKPTDPMKWLEKVNS